MPSKALKAGLHVFIDAGASLTLAAGGQHIVIDPGGILSSVPILLGGAPMLGAPASPVAPQGAKPLVAGVLQSLDAAAQGQVEQILQGALTCPLCLLEPTRSPAKG